MFIYDVTSPSCLRWKVDVLSNNGRVLKSAGDPAGYLHKVLGYWYVGYKREKHAAHIIVYEMHKGRVPDGKDIDHRNGVRSDTKIRNLRAVPHVLNSRNQKQFSNNTSGVTGVSYSDNDGKPKWSASCFDENSVRRRKNFSVGKYGYDEAFKLACEWRETAIEEANKNGAGYTARHGQSSLDKEYHIVTSF